MDTPKVVAPFTSVDEIISLLRQAMCHDAHRIKRHLDCVTLSCSKCIMHEDTDIKVRIQWVKDNMFKQGK